MVDPQERVAEASARYYWLMLAESHLTRRLSGAWDGASTRRQWRASKQRLSERRNQATMEVGVGEVFVECAEKTEGEWVYTEPMPGAKWTCFSQAAERGMGEVERNR